MIDPTGHIPVLGEQVTALLAPALTPGSIMLDCTLGRAGHAAMLLPLLSPGGIYIGLDADPGNVAFSEQRLAPLAAEAAVTLHLLHANFNTARHVLDELRIENVHGLLADLGFASNQMDDPQRGFSFAATGPLDMRLDPRIGRTAADLVNTLPERELADLIYRYGEERLSRKIAKKIVETRQRDPILTTAALAEVVRRAYGPRRFGKRGKGGRRHTGQSRIDPATRTFMALRIAVNDELTALEQLLGDLDHLLRPHARAAIISFHSLEDRLVKQRFLGLQQEQRATRLTRKPITASDEQVRANPRSRSAKLRGIEWAGP